MLQGLAFRCHTHCHAIHYLTLMFLHCPCVMTHHDLLGGVSDVVHRFTDRAAVLHEQGRMSDTQRTERRCRASRLFARLTEMIAQGRRGEWSLSPTGLE